MEVLARAGDAPASTRLMLREFWHGINDRGPDWEAVAPLRASAIDPEELGVDLRQSLIVAQQALDTVYHRSQDLAAFAQAIDQSAHVPFAPEAAVCFAEHCAAAGSFELLAEHAELLRRIANGTMGENSPDSLTRAERLQLRLHMCLADSAEAWTELVRSTRSTMAPDLVPWLAARHARWLALNGHGTEAVERYQDAIEAACRSSDFDDAAGWLYALRACLGWYKTEQIFDDQQHPFAQSLRSQAQPSRLPGSPVLTGLALRGLWRVKDGPGEARQRVSQWRWQSFVRADLVYELDSHRGLATLLEADGDLRSAIPYVIFSTSSDSLKQLVHTIDDRPVQLPASVLAKNPGQRQTAYTAAELFADLIPDELASAWFDAAIADLATGNDQPIPSYVDTWTRAYAAAAELVNAATPAAAEQMLDLIERGQGRIAGPRSDLSDRAKLLTGIAASFPELSLRAMKLVLPQIALDQFFARSALNWRPPFVDNQPLVEQIMHAPATDPSNGMRKYACLAMAFAGLEQSAPVRQYAKEQIQVARNYRPSAANVLQYRSGHGALVFLSRSLDLSDKSDLAEALLTEAGERREAIENRRSALRDLATLCQFMDNASRAALLPRLKPFVAGEFDGGPRFFEGWSGTENATQSLTRAALHAAACVTTAPDVAWIEQQGQNLLAGADQSEATQVARAFALVQHPQHSTLPIELFAVHPNPGLRAFAAVRLCQRNLETDIPIVMSLAKDPVTIVRSSLAGQLEGHYPEHPATAVLAHDTRRSIRLRVTARLH